MTISSTNTKDQHNGNGSATSFNYTFKILDQSHLEVIKTSTTGVDTALSITTDYTVSGVGIDAGGAITYPVTGTALASGEKITIRRKQDFLQSVDLQNQGGFFAEVHEDAFDKQAMFALQNKEELDRTLRAPVTDPTSIDLTIPAKDTRKGTVLAFNATTGDTEVGPKIADVSSLASITSDIATVAAISANVTTVSSISTNVTTTASISANVTTVASISSDVTSVAADATDIGAVAAKATEIGRLGTADAVSDMNTLGTADVVSDMNTLATADIVSDMNTLATADVVTDMNVLATSDVVSDMNVLATSDIVSDMNTLGTADVVSDMNTLGTSANVTNMATLGASGVVANIASVAADATDIGAVAEKATEIGRLGTAAAVADLAILGTADIVADMAILATTDVVADLNTLGTADVVSDLNTLGTADVVADLNTLGTADVVADMNTLATSDIVSDMNTLATSANVTNMASVAGSISDVNRYANEYKIAATAPGSPTEGDLWYDSTSNILKYYDGSSWVASTGSGHVELTGLTGSAKLPAGTTAQRDGSPAAGYLRWNSTDTSAEVYDGSSWAAVGGGNSTTEGLYEHANTISANYSISSGSNALTAGPITINTGVSVTIPTGSTWVIA
jgi:hypothetical protein